MSEFIVSLPAARLNWRTRGKQALSVENDIGEGDSWLEEKMADLFAAARSDSGKEMVQKYRKAFNIESLSEDWGQVINDEELKLKWDRIFSGKKVNKIETV